MIISPPFLPAAGLTAGDNDATPPKLDPMMDEVDKYELAHGIYPIAFDRRWHCGVHLMPSTQNEKVRAIADGEVVAYRVCQKAYDGGDGAIDSNAGFVLLKHETETGEGRMLRFYSLYMHLLDLNSYQSMSADGKLLPEFLRMPSPGGDLEPAPAQSGSSTLKVRRKDVIGWIGGCHGQRHLHFEIFMTQSDHDTYFGRTQLGHPTASMATGSDCWGHNYFTIPAGKSFKRLPDGTDAHGKLHGLAFEALQAGQNAAQLFVEMFFHKGSKYTNVWAVASDGKRTLLTATPVKEKDYEYDMYKRTTALYPTCASDGYELLRFGRILSPSPKLKTSAERRTWMRVAFEAGQEGYIDISDDAILKLSDADFSTFMDWQKITEGNTPFSADGLCDIDALKKILRDVKDHQTPQDSALKQEYKKEDVLAQYVKSNASVREQLRGFICEAPSEWDSSHNEERYRKLKDEGEFYHGDDAGYAAFMKRLTSFQFWNKTGPDAGQKLWFFHPLAFIRQFRKCGWLSHKEFANTFPRYPYYTNSGSPASAITTDSSTYVVTKAVATARIQNHVVPLNQTIRKYLGSDARRIAIFLAQVLLETAQWRDLGGVRRLMHEWGFGKYSAANPATRFYGPFYGRGIMQLTWAGNFSEYGTYRALSSHSGSYVERLPNSVIRITETSEHYNFNPKDGGTPMRWFPRFDPDRIAEEPFLACDSGGFYWISKPFSQGLNINRVADKEYSVDNIGFVNRLVNGGFNGYNERQAYTIFIINELWDAMPGYFPEIIAPTRRATIRPDLTRCND